ncbi:MAG: Gfo/Idh/MocA family oxidoreductase [Burkholderiaceae bacterium]|nr:Gfo/Idh/MocA family oxidoreductase [Microbacteriaceae bacterium]
MPSSLGIAVIGAGMAGKAHAAAYRVAPTLFDPLLPPLRFVSVADVNESVGAHTAKRFGYERSDSSWQAIVEADDIDVVSVVVANHLHREIVEALLAAGKHVLCDKPMAGTLEDARAMAAAAASASSVARLGFTFHRAPGIVAIRNLILDGTLGPVLHYSGRYWADYASDPQGAMSWRYKGGPGSGALADIGSHVTYIAEYFAGEIRSVSGGRLSTEITERPLPLGPVIGHEHTPVSDVYESVENDDYAAFSVAFERGVGSIEASRVAGGHPNTMIVEVFCENGSAVFDQRNPSEIGLYLPSADNTNNGFRRVQLGSGHPYIAGGLAMDSTGVGFGQNDSFNYQARAFLDEVAGLDEASSLPRNASFDDGVHNMEILAAATESALGGGRTVDVHRVGASGLAG